MSVCYNFELIMSGLLSGRAPQAVLSKIGVGFPTFRGAS